MEYAIKQQATTLWFLSKHGWIVQNCIVNFDSMRKWWWWWWRWRWRWWWWWRTSEVSGVHTQNVPESLECHIGMLKKTLTLNYQWTWSKSWGKKTLQLPTSSKHLSLVLEFQLQFWGINIFVCFLMVFFPHFPSFSQKTMPHHAACLLRRFPDTWRRRRSWEMINRYQQLELVGYPMFTQTHSCHSL